MSYTKNILDAILSRIDNEHLIGHTNLIKSFMITYFCKGHLLIEGPPGTGKTLSAKLFSSLLGQDFKRIQLTSDMLPSDILGASVFSPKTQDFTFIEGPVFAQFILADELNRTPPRTQSALLEAMEERQVTVEGISRPLDPNFFVIATQNPRDFEGTFPLPEAQLDRFFMQIKIDNLDVDNEQLVLKQFLSNKLPHLDGPKIEPLNIDRNQIDQEIESIQIDPSFLSYIANIVYQTRIHPQLQWGASTRASLALLKAARMLAAIENRNFLIPDDIKSLAVPVLQHRIQLHPEAQISGVTPTSIIQEILQQIPIPS